VSAIGAEPLWGANVSELDERQVRFGPGAPYKTKTMKLWLKALIVLFVASSLFLIGLHLFLNLKGKDFLIRKLEEATKRKVTIGDLSTTFPVNITIKDLDIKGLLKVDDIYASLGFIELSRRSLGLSLLKLNHPELTMERNAVSQPAAAATPAESVSPPKPEAKPVDPPAPARPFMLPTFYIDRFIVNDGAFTFIDKFAENKEISIKFQNLNIKVDNLNLSHGGSRITYFDLKGKMPWREGSEEGKIALEGWVNLIKKDMRASVKIQDIDAIYFYPYYSNWVDLEKARIEKAKLNFTSDIDALNNDLVAQCHLELTDIVFKPKPAEGEEKKAEKIASAILDIFKALNQKVVLDFTIRTKMTSPEFGFGNIQGAVADKINQRRKGDTSVTQEVVLFPARIIEGTVKGGTEMTKAVISGTFSVFKELGKGFFSVFEKEKE
jgi:hypothetical protein